MYGFKWEWLLKMGFVVINFNKKDIINEYVFFILKWWKKMICVFFEVKLCKKNYLFEVE